MQRHGLRYAKPPAPGKRSVGSALLDLIWPPRSLLSEALVDRPGVIEAARWRELAFLGPPWCARCGFPFQTEAEACDVCATCAADPPAFDRARAALAYNDAAAALVLGVKRGGRRDGLGVFASWMAEAGAEVLAEAELLIPAPLHWTRLLERKFNQSAWLSQALSRRTQVPVLVDGLARILRRSSQEGLNARQRFVNVRGAYKVKRAMAARIAGRAVVLIDDVLTTGATAQACAKALKRAGAGHVSVLTLARVVRPGALLI